MSKTAKHPGVVLIKPDGKHGWRMRYMDPDFQKLVRVAIDRTFTNEAQRVAVAVAQSKKLSMRRFELAKGAPRSNGLTLKEVIDSYFSAHPHLREKTLRVYRIAATALYEWCGKHSITTADDLTPHALFSFREWLNRRPKRQAAKGTQGRGKHTESSKRRSAHSINRDLRSTHTVLAYLCKKKLFSKLNSHELSESLEKFQTSHEQPEFMKVSAIAKLIAAAEKHDRETFKMTRHDQINHKYVSETVRYEPITPFVLFVLLTGMRFSEAAELTWAGVDLEAQSIHLRADETKTKYARRVDLSITPILLSILSGLHERKAKDELRVFPHVTAEGKAEMLRLRFCGAPDDFTWLLLRSTCATYGTNSGGIWGTAASFQSAKRLGHSVVVAERHYVGLVNVPKEATTLEQAMGIVPLASELDAPMAKKIGRPRQDSNLRHPT